ncbi:MAG: hypothetical protein GYB65_00300 [Chloroflexi bacterium]|nr:hypothetical protein [Chloroflexota bacterium]
MPPEAITTLLALFAFAVFHSLTVLVPVKAGFAALVGQRAYLGLYRLLYNIVSVLTFLPVLAVMYANPGPTIWAADAALSAVLMAVQIIGVLGAGVAALQIDILRFAGLKQAWAYLNGDRLPLPPEPLQVGGVYALVRHPLYLFAMLYLWANPTMNAAALAFAAGTSVYFVFGAWIEEQRFLRTTGALYHTYRCRVPFMIPFLKLPDARCREA